MTKNKELKPKSTGQQVKEFLEKDEHKLYDIRDIGRYSQQEEYVKLIKDTIESGTKLYPNNDLFICVLDVWERILLNKVWRSRFGVRITCPYPSYDQRIYHFNHKLEELKLLWAIPSKKSCQYYLSDPGKITKENVALMEYIYKFYNGDLEALAKKYNNEEE